MTYSLYSPTQTVTSADIVAKLDRAFPLHRAHIASVERLEANGMTYSGEDGDVLGAAWTVARTGRTVPHSFEQAWIDANA